MGRVGGVYGTVGHATVGHVIVGHVIVGHVCSTRRGEGPSWVAVSGDCYQGRGGDFMGGCKLGDCYEEKGGAFSVK